jgi:hypothetical protein
MNPASRAPPSLPKVATPLQPSNAAHGNALDDWDAFCAVRVKLTSAPMWQRIRVERVWEAKTGRHVDMGCSNVNVTDVSGSNSLTCIS